MGITRKHVALLSVALAVVLAGCGGGGGGTATPADQNDDGNDGPLLGGTDTPVPDDGTPEPADTATPGTETPGETPQDSDGSTPTATPTATATAAPPADGSTPTDTGEQSVMAQHRQALQSKVGYQVNFTWGVYGEESGWVNFTGYQLYDMRNLEAFQWMKTGYNRPGMRTLITETYSPPESTVSHICPVIRGSCARVIQEDTNFNETDSYVTPFTSVTNLSESPEFTDAGTVQTDEGTRHRYVLTNASQLPESDRDVEFLEADVEVLVDPDSGLVTDIVWDVTFRNPAGNVVRWDRVIHYQWLDSVDVPVPDWYAGESS